MANELGLTKAALYYYFKGKDALLFELMLHLLLAEGAAIEAAVSETDNGADAVEAQIRTTLAHYEGRLPDFRLVYAIPTDPKATPIPNELIEQVRPLNDMVYGSVEKRLVADRERGELPDDVHPRRLAFLSHMSALGILTMRSMTEQQGDPLIHSTDDLANDLVAVFRKAIRK